MPPLPAAPAEGNTPFLLDVTVLKNFLKVGRFAFSHQLLRTAYGPTDKRVTAFLESLASWRFPLSFGEERPMSNTIPLAKAEAGIRAIFEMAAKDGKPPVAVAVVDRHGDLTCFARMDGAPVRTSTLGPNKAYTAARMERHTADLLKMIHERRLDVAFCGDPRYCALPGGLVVKDGNRTVGGIGVSGRSSEEDHELGLIALKICQA